MRRLSLLYGSIRFLEIKSPTALSLTVRRFFSTAYYLFSQRVFDDRTHRLTRHYYDNWEPKHGYHNNIWRFIFHVLVNDVSRSLTAVRIASVEPKIAQSKSVARAVSVRFQLQATCDPQVTTSVICWIRLHLHNNCIYSIFNLISKLPRCIIITLYYYIIRVSSYLVFYFHFTFSVKLLVQLLILITLPLIFVLSTVESVSCLDVATRRRAMKLYDVIKCLCAVKTTV